MLRAWDVEAFEARERSERDEAEEPSLDDEAGDKGGGGTLPLAMLARVAVESRLE